MLSVIVPVLNEAPALPQLVRELIGVAATHGYDLQTIIVDDGSTDGTWDVICGLAAEDSRVLGIVWRRTLGKAAGRTPGFPGPGGDQIVTTEATCRIAR